MTTTNEYGETSDTPSEDEVVLLVPREKKLVLDDGRGNRAEYVIREMDGAARDQFIDHMAKRTKIVDGKPAGMSSYTGLYSALIVRCLTCDGKKVPEPVIQAFPASVVSRLYKICEDMNALGKDAEADEKKS